MVVIVEEMTVFRYYRQQLQRGCSWYDYRQKKVHTIEMVAQTKEWKGGYIHDA